MVRGGWPCATRVMVTAAGGRQGAALPRVGIGWRWKLPAEGAADRAPTSWRSIARQQPGWMRSMRRLYSSCPALWQGWPHWVMHTAVRADQADGADNRCHSIVAGGNQTLIIYVGYCIEYRPTKTGSCLHPGGHSTHHKQSALVTASASVPRTAATKLSSLRDARQIGACVMLCKHESAWLLYEHSHQLASPCESRVVEMPLAHRAGDGAIGELARAA